MPKLSLIYAGTIKDIQERDDLILITDSQEVEAVLNHITFPSVADEITMEFSGLLVSIKDGDYLEIFAYEGTIPYLFENLWKINIQS